MIFDGTKGVRFKYNGKEYKEVIDPMAAEGDPDLEDVWSYELCTYDDNIFMVLLGNYDDEGNLLTTELLQVRVQDMNEGIDAMYIDDIDIVGAEECKSVGEDAADILEWAEKYGYQQALEHLVRDIMPTTIYKEQMHQIAVELWEWEH